jgi:small subunit ribosomal protein S8
MTMTDTIADMLTRIRNASRAKHPDVDVPCSNEKQEIARVLKEKGFIKNWERMDDGKQGILKISLRYGKNGEDTIGVIKRVSRPGLRLWVKAKDIPRVHGGVGIAIVSTSKGIKTDEECRKENIGGEVLCYVW